MNRQPQWLSVALWIALLASILTGWSPLYWPVAASISALAVVAVLWGIFGGQLQLVPELAAVVLIAAWGPLQMLLNRSAVPAMTIRASMTWAGCAVAFLLGSNLLSERRARHLFLKLLCWSLALLALEALFQYFLWPQKVFGIFDGPDSVVGTLFYRNQFAALMEIGGAAALWQILQGRTVIGALCFATTLGAVVATASRAGAVLMGIELLAFVALTLAGKARARNSRSVVLVVLTFVLASAAVVGTDTLWDRFQEKDLFATRRELRASTLSMIPEAPVLGTGMGTWRAAYPRYATLDASLVANEAHNDWLQWMADGGIPFFAFMAVLALRAGTKASADVWGLGLLAVMAHCLVDYPMRTPAISFLWFTLAGAACALRREPDYAEGRKRSIS